MTRPRPFPELAHVPCPFCDGQIGLATPRSTIQAASHSHPPCEKWKSTVFETFVAEAIAALEARAKEPTT